MISPGRPEVAPDSPEPGRSSPLAASRRYYPGFFGALFLVVLRIAIGWHFFYEGTQKILSTPTGKASILGQIFPIPTGPVFSAEPYLRASNGPMAPFFRSLIPDVDSRDQLDPAQIKATFAMTVGRVADHFNFDAAQLEKAGVVLKDRSDVVDTWFESLENREKVRKYLDELNEIDAIDRNREAMSYERENALADRKTAETDRKALVTEVAPWNDTLRDSLIALATPAQAKEAGTYTPHRTRMDWINLSTMYGLTAIGFCLIFGLFTPAAALGGATYLLSFYLSMPPWPGLPEGIVEGHYRYINKNLIEMFALLALAATPSGLWIGLDALLFGWIGRAERRREIEEAAMIVRQATAPPPRDDRKFKKR